MIFIALTMLGYVSYKQLSVELFPNPTLPMLFVSIGNRVEIDPRYSENEAVIPVEGAIGSMENVEKIETFINQRNSFIIVYYEKNTDLKYAYLKLTEKINEVQANLSDDYIVQVQKADIEQTSGQFMDLQVRGEGGVDRVRNIVDKEITPNLQNIDGIASVNVFGGREKSIEIIMNETVSRAHNITPSRVRSLIMNQSTEKTFVGQVYNYDKEYFVHVTSEFGDITDIEEIVVSESANLRLKDIAEVNFGVKEETSISRVNGKEAVTIQIINEAQANIIDLSDDVRANIEELNKELAYLDVEIVVDTDNAETMKNNIDQIIQLALTGGLIAVFVLWIFLKNISLVTAIGIAIPVSVYSAFNFFYAADISINTLTLIGIALAVGMLLDNSVVVLENIYRLRSLNHNAEHSVREGTRQVLRSVIAATATTITVFTPFVFSSNFLIELFGKNISVSITSTLLVSLLAALFFIPMVTHFFMTNKRAENAAVYHQFSLHNRLVQVYVLILKACMRNPLTTIIGALVLFFAVIIIGLAINFQRLEEVETTSFRVSVIMPTGSSLNTTDELVSSLEEEMMKIEEVEDVISNIQEENASISLNLKEDFKKIADRSIPQIRGTLNGIIDRFDDDATIEFESFQTGGGGGNRRESMSGSNQALQFQNLLGIGTNEERILIKGQDFEKMRHLAEDIEYFLNDNSSVQSVRMNISQNQPEIHLGFDQLLLSQNNITLNNIAGELAGFQREFSSGGIFKYNNEEYDITIKTDTVSDEESKSVEDLEKLEITSETDAVFDLSEISDIYYSSGMGRITRVNQDKQIEITYRFTEDIQNSKELTEAGREEIEELVSFINVPAGVAVEVGQEESELKEFYFLIGAAFILIYMILAAVFESLTTPFVVMFSIPLAAIGSFLGLIFTGNQLFTVNTLTGFLILLGVVVNNSIILIDFTKVLQRKGYRMSRALVTAGIARLRPILITSITTIVAMIPLGMGKTEFVGTIGAPFAITVIGGLSVSALLTLVFVPTFYAGLESSLNWIKNLKLQLQLAMLAIFGIALWQIYTEVYSFIWQLVYTILVLILIPGAVWFVMNSLKKANAKLLET